MACHGNSVNNTKAIQLKKFLRDAQMNMYALARFLVHFEHVKS